MLRISKLVDYGTMVMVYLAMQSEVFCNARVIAEKVHLSVPTVSKLLKRLTAAGLLLSTRGVAGGYRLKRSAADISLAEILYALEDHWGLTECSKEPNLCLMKGVCAIQGNWQLINKAILAALESVSLEAFSQPTLTPAILQRLQQYSNGVYHGEKQ